jgi:protein-tyrosine phosphatase
MATEPGTARLLPEPRDAAAPYRIAVVCLGNICRSPMADVVLNRLVEEAGLAGAVEVVSAGTGDWHVGKPMDARAADTLTAHGYDASRHRAQQIEPSWLDENDLVLAMDEANLTSIGELGDRSRVRMFRDFDPLARDDDHDVPDPYFGDDDGFEHVLAMVERTAGGLVDALASTRRPGV